MSGKLILWVLFNLPFDEYVTAFIDGINKKRSHDYFCSSPLASNELVKMLWGGAGGGAQGKGGEEIYNDAISVDNDVDVVE